MSQSNLSKTQIVDILIANAYLVSQWYRFHLILLGRDRDPYHTGFLITGVKRQTLGKFQLFNQIVTMWTAKKGNEATIESLIQTLRRGNFIEAADNLEAGLKVKDNPSTSVGVLSSGTENMEAGFEVQDSTGIPSTKTGKKVDGKLVVPVLIKHAQVVTNWKRLYETMLPEEAGGIVQLRNNFANGTIDEYELFNQIISRWVSRYASDATYKRLEEILREIEENNVAAEILGKCLIG